MATTRQILQQEIFDQCDQKLLAFVGVSYDSKKKKFGYYLCLSDTKGPPSNIFIHQIKFDCKIVKKKRMWSLIELITVDGKTSSQDCLEIELTFDKPYKWVATNSRERKIFLISLWKQCASYVFDKKPKFKNLPLDWTSGDLVVLPADRKSKLSLAVSLIISTEDLKKKKKEKKEQYLALLMKECGFAAKDAKAFTDMLATQLMALDSENVQSVLASEPQVIKLMDQFETAIKEIEKVGLFLNYYDDTLNQVKNTNDKMDPKNVNIQTADSNNEKLLNELQKLIEVNKNVRSILNKIIPENMVPLTKRFKLLPIDTMKRLEKTADLVFETAIEEQSFSPLYASLCSAMQYVQVSCGEGDKMTSFKKLIISKCQSLFEQDKAQELDSPKKFSEINSCKDPEKKKELQLEYEENERILRKRSVGNCRFIGELFKQKILTPNIMFLCIVNLVTKHVEEPLDLECLCNLLKTVGKEVEQSYNLNETFDKLKALTSNEMKSKIPSSIRFMIQDVIDLRRDKWIPRPVDIKPKFINEIENDAKNEAIEQSMALSYRPEKRDHHRSDDKFSRGGGNKSRRGNTTKFKQQNYQARLQGFKESSSVVTTIDPSSKWSFSISGGGKNSSFTSNNTLAVLNDDKKSTSSHVMPRRTTSRKPVISEIGEKQRMMSGMLQSQLMEMTSNSQPLQVPQPPSTTLMQIPEPKPPQRKNLAFKIIDINTGEVSLNNTLQALPSADELEKMKVQSQFQSQVQSVVKKDDTKVFDSNQNNEGGENVRKEFQTQVKKLSSEPSLTPSKVIEVDETQLPEETLSKTEETSVVTPSIEEVSVTTSDSTLAVGLTVSSEEVLDVNVSDKEMPTNSLPSSTPTHKVQILNTETVTSISEDIKSAKTNVEEESSKPGLASMMPQFALKNPPLNPTNLPSMPKETIDEPNLVELDLEVVNKINRQCKNIIQEYEQMHNLEDIIYLLAVHEKSEIRTRHEEFVKSMCLITLDSNPNSRTEAGKLFAELLSKKVISMAAVTQGIDGVLKDWNDYLMDYPQLFSSITAIITPLLISKTASFEFCNLKDACISICPDNSSIFFTEVLQRILSSKETQNIKEQVGGILWIYNKWRISENVTLDAFMPTNQINNHFKNDRVGVFLLSIAMYDKMRLTDSKQLHDVMHSWLSTNFNAEIIKIPHFVRALTIAIVIICLKPNHSYEDFFDHVHVKLLTLYIRSFTLPEPEIQAREVQCLYGIQIMSAALEHPGGMVLKLFHKLYQDSIISKESFKLWKKEDEFKPGFDEDLETKTMAVVVLNSFFLSLETNDSDDDEAANQ